MIKEYMWSIFPTLNSKIEPDVEMDINAPLEHRKVDISELLRKHYGPHWLTICSVEYFMSENRWKDDYVLEFPIWNVDQVSVLR